MAWVPFAKKESVPSHSGPMSAHQGLVLHVQVGDGDCYGEFSNPDNQASSTWWVAKDGTLVQYVDSDLAAWTEAAGNFTWDSVETEGYPTEALTNAQILTLARLYAWGVQQYRWPLNLAETPSDTGFGWHGMGGVAWGNHPNCPGDLRKAQRPAIVYIAALALAQYAPTYKESEMIATSHTGNGYFIAHPDGSVWSFGDAVYAGGCNPGAPVGGGSLPAGVTIVGIASHPTANGYWLRSSAGAVYAFGAAQYHGAA